MTDKLFSTLSAMEKENRRLSDALSDGCSLSDYLHLVRGGVWTDALQRALSEHTTVTVPPSDVPYTLDAPIVIPSDRTVVAYGAVFVPAPGVRTLMMRNEHPVDGSRLPVRGAARDRNITILGGSFDERLTARKGYGLSGRFSEDGSFKGVSCCLFFCNVDRLTLRDVTFAHCGGFAVQTGELENAVFRNVRFEDCFADGIHICGNTKNVLMVDIKGSVGDDIVALNMYDWQNSSVNFGPGENIWCEDLSLDKNGRYKAIRLEPGRYFFDDGSSVDCSLKNVVIKKVRGIRTFKIYLQTPPYLIGTDPERGDKGSAENITFEDIDVDLCAPIDPFPDYSNGDPVRGACAAFELGADTDGLTLRNVRLTLHRDALPESYLLTVGPKSIVNNGHEVFDPYISCAVKNITLDNVVINGEKITDCKGFIKEIVFDDIDGDGFSTGAGKVENITVL
ncbi:MAG: hypothetical protein J5940_03030 [Clostridia bacterium]|nr:hypothetical protein [Clostridia bacterium]